ncbi:hypothetical protein KEM56_001472 [Ascosphaera pollenicola]|nr:hypothetical protein KEM56_001472 [Ascosphaera pollenicola]
MPHNSFIETTLAEYDFSDTDSPSSLSPALLKKMDDLATKFLDGQLREENFDDDDSIVNPTPAMVQTSAIATGDAIELGLSLSTTEQQQKHNPVPALLLSSQPAVMLSSPTPPRLSPSRSQWHVGGQFVCVGVKPSLVQVLNSHGYQTAKLFFRPSSKRITPSASGSTIKSTHAIQAVVCQAVGKEANCYAGAEPDQEPDQALDQQQETELPRSRRVRGASHRKGVTPD